MPAKRSAAKRKVTAEEVETLARQLRSARGGGYRRWDELEPEFQSEWCRTARWVLRHYTLKGKKG
jgi:hypothetical protein